MILDAGGDDERGGVDEPGGGVVVGEGTSAHWEVDSAANTSPFLGSHCEFLPMVELSCSDVSDSGGVFIKGLSEGEGTLALMERGCKMLKI